MKFDNLGNVEKNIIQNKKRFCMSDVKLDACSMTYFLPVLLSQTQPRNNINVITPY